ncbi:hypothetical protein BSL78_13783 [Apostichopus japonicus]|uniref:Uncharacterized protein n=1 Tax=Stichopus japonicus TaxID=307972 RepID=A0A2G8KMS1_STIJA|nr:hypothetical protein BSL78_13783 [Apostichopus japonicus]
MYRKLELMGGSICGLRRQFSATTKSLSTASATSTPLETIGSTTSRGTTLSGTSTLSQSKTVSTSLATEIKDNSTEETIATSSSAVTMATTGIPGPSDALSIIEWFLVAVAVAALIFFLYILYHFCQVKRKRKASAFSEQNKNIIEYATPQSPKEKWRNSWALEAMVYHMNSHRKRPLRWKRGTT